MKDVTAEHSFIVIDGVTELVQLSKPTIYKLMNQGRFPRPVKLSAQRVAWLREEIDDWIAERVKERDAALAAAVSALHDLTVCGLFNSKNVRRQINCSQINWVV